MKTRFAVLCLGLLLVAATGSWATTVYSWEMSPSFAGLSRQVASNDLIEGMMVGNGAVIEAGGFHWAFPELNDAARLTDGQLGGGTDSVLQDYGYPSLRISYTFPEQPVQEILSFAGNPAMDGRVFQDMDIEVLVGTDWFEIIHEATTGPYYVSNQGNEASLIRVYEQEGGMLLGGVPIDGVRLTYWCVDNTQNWFLPRDAGPVGASIVKEIDVVVPEPASMVVLLAGIGGLLIRRRPR
jgi:hypothetical protein